jgi:hypothetical protein
MTYAKVASLAEKAVSNRSINGKEATRMHYSHQGWFQRLVQFLRRQFLQDGDLPFTNILSEETISPAQDKVSWACFIPVIASVPFGSSFGQMCWTRPVAGKTLARWIGQSSGQIRFVCGVCDQRRPARVFLAH